MKAEQHHTRELRDTIPARKSKAENVLRRVIARELTIEEAEKEMEQYRAGERGCEPA